MKLSHLTLGVLLVSASVANAQDNKSKLKSDSLKNKHKIKPLTPVNAQKKDTIKLREKREEVLPRYCGPCGMG